MSVIPIDIRTGTIKKERIIGIDLGTTNSLVAYLHDDHPAIISNKKNGERLLPSIVYFDDEFNVIVGSEAKEHQSIQPQRTVYSVKRLMGKVFSDIVSNEFSYHISEKESEKICKIEISNEKESRFFTPIEISSILLKELKKWADEYFEEPVQKAVITVPAHFNDAERNATKLAGKLAGLDVIRIINEPTAAALAYGLDNTKDGTVVVYDLGGGTFDISILKLDNGIFDVLSTNGNTHLGGDDIDYGIAKYLLEKLNQETPHEFTSNILPELRIVSEKAKRELTLESTTLIQMKVAENYFTYKLTREELEKIALPIIQKTKNPCEIAMKDAGITVKDISSVVLVGGATRSPFVKKFVQEMFGKIPYDSINPDEVVALGAGIQAGILAGQKDDVLLLDVTPLSLGIETMGGVVSSIITRNSKIPIRMMQEFTTYVDNQTGVDIHIVQGERELAKDNRSLAKFTLKPIPPMPAGMPRILVSFTLDGDGILSVSAKDKHSERQQSIEVKTTYGLTDEEVEEMLLAGFQYAEDDVENRLFIEAKLEAESMLHSFEKSVQKNDDVFASFSLQEKNKILEGKKKLEQSLQGISRSAIEEATHEFNDATLHFAHIIMNNLIKETLQSKSIDAV